MELGTPPGPYCSVVVLQSYQGASTQLTNEPDQFYCERIMLDMFPFLGRFDESDVDTVRFWQWMLCTIDDEELVEWLDNDATTVALADFYDNSSQIWSDTAHILQQGVAPVYFSTLLSFDQLGGALNTEFDEPIGTVTSNVMPFGESAVRGIDLKVKFSLKQGQSLVLLAGPANDPAWVDGDSFTLGVWYKSLWTQRRP